MFSAADRFMGARKGYVFKSGGLGLGYYKESDEIDEDPVWKKRKLVASSSTSSSLEHIQAAEVVDVNEHEVANLTRKLEKCLQENLELRSRFETEPAKFMQSEMDVDDAINELKVLASVPSLYAEMAKVGLPALLMELIAHPNEDISKDVLGLLVELLDEEVLLEVPSKTDVFVDGLVNARLLDVVVENLQRFDESQESGSVGVYQSMDVLETLLTMRKDLNEQVFPKLVPFLLKRLNTEKHDANKLYASEVLAILLTVAPENRSRFDEKMVESLLKAANLFRKRIPESPEEEECIASTFSCLCSVLLFQGNQQPFLKLEGVSLMLLIAKERRFAYPHAIKVLSHALDRSKEGCTTFVDENGLKTLFPLFMGRSLKIKMAKDKHTKRINKETEEIVTSNVLNILQSLLTQISPESIQYRRVIRKLVEQDLEKTDRLIELHVQYYQRVESVRGRFEEESYLERLEAGMEQLQHVDIVLAHLWQLRDESICNRVEGRLYENKLNVDSIRQVLQELCHDMAENEKQRQQLTKLINNLQ